VAPNPDRELAEARACIDRGDARKALKRLDRARRGYLKQHDTEGLEHLLMLADLLDPPDERTSIGRTNLVYAIKQNLRLETRRRAARQSEQWSDPYPDLQAPTEHTGIAFTRGVKLAIALGTLVGAAVLFAIFVLPFFFSTSQTNVTVRIVNDTQSEVSVHGCGDSSCFSTWMDADLAPGRFTERRVSVDDLVDLFRFKQNGEDTCLPLRVHDGYEEFGEDSRVVLVGRLSLATPCPGTTVLPDAGKQTGL
jgi:hypothetical protein